MSPLNNEVVVDAAEQNEVVVDAIDPNKVVVEIAGRNNAVTDTAGPNDEVRQAAEQFEKTVSPAPGSPSSRKVTAELRQSLTDVYDVERSLSVGETMLMQGKLRSHPFKVTLAGWISGDSIFVSPPLAVLAAGQIVKEEFLLVRYLFLGKVFGFETTAHKIVLDPPLVILEWPTQVEVAAISKEERILARMNITVILYNELKEQVPVKAMLIEISQGGCRIKMTWNNDFMEYCLPDSQVDLSLPLDRAGGMLHVYGLVRNFAKQGSFAVLGLQFKNESPEFRQQLQQILNVQLMR